MPKATSCPVWFGGSPSQLSPQRRDRAVGVPAPVTSLMSTRSPGATVQPVVQVGSVTAALAPMPSVRSVVMSPLASFGGLLAGRTSTVNVSLTAGADSIVIERPESVQGAGTSSAPTAAIPTPHDQALIGVVVVE